MQAIHFRFPKKVVTENRPIGKRQEWDCAFGSWIGPVGIFGCVFGRSGEFGGVGLLCADPIGAPARPNAIAVVSKTANFLFMTWPSWRIRTSTQRLKHISRHAVHATSTLSSFVRCNGIVKVN